MPKTPLHSMKKGESVVIGPSVQLTVPAGHSGPPSNMDRTRSPIYWELQEQQPKFVISSGLHGLQAQAKRRRRYIDTRNPSQYRHLQVISRAEPPGSLLPKLRSVAALALLHLLNEAQYGQLWVVVADAGVFSSSELGLAPNVLLESGPIHTGRSDSHFAFVADGVYPCSHCETCRICKKAVPREG